MVGEFQGGHPALLTSTASGAATLGGIACQIVQRKMWRYHDIPMMLASALLVGITLAERLERRNPGKVVRVASGLAVVPIALFGTHASLSSLGEESWHNDVTSVIETHSRVGERVAFLLTSVAPAYPALTQTARLPGTRYLWLFALPMLLPDGCAAAANVPPSPAEERFVHEIEQDVHTRKFA